MIGNLQHFCTQALLTVCIAPVRAKLDWRDSPSVMSKMNIRLLWVPYYVQRQLQPLIGCSRKNGRSCEPFAAFIGSHPGKEPST
jgi:hypothetical protein